MVVHRAAVAALEEFGCHDVASIERLPQGVKNLTYRVHADGEDWVLKCHRQPGAKEQLASSQRLELACSEAGLPVPSPRRGRAGEMHVKIPAGLFTMQPWVAGQQISIDQRDDAHARHPDLARRLGALLGELHRIGSRQPKVVRFTTHELLAAPQRIVKNIRFGRPYRFRKTLRLRLHAGRTDFGSWILEHLPGLYREAAALAEPLVAPRIDSSDLVFAHNDLNWENFIFDEEFQVVALLDFDNASAIPRTLEVGSAAAVLLGADRERLEEFLTAYTDVAGCEVDPAAVEIAMRWKCVRSILWSVDAHLSGRVGNPEMIATWCQHLHECLAALGPLDASQDR